jgi:hypothetical protein
MNKVFQTLDDLRQVVFTFWMGAEDACTTTEAFNERRATLRTVLDQLDSLETRSVQGLLDEWGAHKREIVREIVTEFERQSVLNP